MKLLAITTGDPDGVGLEVSAKALWKLGPQKNFLFFLFRPASPLNSKSSTFRSPLERALALLDQRFQRKTFFDPSSALDFLKKSSWAKTGGQRRSLLVDLSLESSAPSWVETAATLCQKKIFSGLITAPLSKALIDQEGKGDLGHTEILQRVCEVKRIFPFFYGPQFSVLLASSHLPLSEVPRNLTPKFFSEVLSAAEIARGVLTPAKRARPMAVLGLNPHAGEGGLIGDFEKTFLSSFCKKKSLVGPLSPDAAFLPSEWKKYSLYIACYHDQGLIPFKLVHGSSDGVQISLGLSFPRTSVDHGTAKNLYGKNKAQYGSMLHALKKAMDLAK